MRIGSEAFARSFGTPSYRLLALAWLIVTVPCPVWAEAAFEIQPATTVLEGEPISIRLIGAPKGKRVTIRATRVLKDLTAERKPVVTVYRSRAVFDATDGGALDLSTATPVQGSYKSADVRGLFWSMRPVKNEQAKEFDRTKITLVASIGGSDIATTTITLQPALPEVKVVPVKEFPGAVFAALPSTQPRPAVIVLGGSEGNAYAANDMSPRLASRGFAVLGLPYHSPAWSARDLPELPGTFVDIPVERLETAFEWLRQRPDVDSSRVALYGCSKGAEFALIAATRFNWIRAVVAIVPSDVVWEGFGQGVQPGLASSFAFRGEALPFVPYKDMDREFTRLEDIRIRRPSDAGRAAYPATAVAARIPVERFRGPLMVIGGHDDQVWASGMMAQNIAERRAAAGLETENLVFLEAGHLLSGTGFEPASRAYGGRVNFGGTLEADAHAQSIAFPRTMAFLRRTLGE